jgi:hypothetical protein
MPSPPIIDDIPDYAVGDPFYDGCEGDPIRIRVQRFLHTYVTFVKQRYGQSSFRFVKHTTYPALMGTRWVKLFEEGLGGLGDRDPAHLMAYIFDNFSARKSKFAKKHSKQRGAIGLAYPSVEHLACNLKDYVEEFLAIREYKPTQFIPVDDLAKRDEAVMEHLVGRWCSLTGKTPKDYWLVPQHILPPFLTSRDIPYAKSLWENEGAVKEHYDMTIEELRAQLKALEEALEHASAKRYEELEALGEYLNDRYQEHICTIADSEMFDRITVERIRITKEALAQGIDVASDSFQKELEKRLDFYRPEFL